MKYLLKQQIRRVNKGGKTKVFPGNPGLINLANELKIPYKRIEKQEGEYIITESYIFETKDYNHLLEVYQTRIKGKRAKFYTQDPLIQLIKILKYIYKRNTDAKIVDRYTATLNAYGDKSKFLEMALQLAQKVKHFFFKFGYELDPTNSYHQYIYYFEIEGLGQVSFHSEKLYSHIPQFSGKWIGIENERYPFDLREVKKLIRGLVKKEVIISK